MQLESLKVFCDIVNFRSFSKAAEENDLPQPTVSRWVHQLEVRLGGQLFDRSKRPFQLTPLGQAYYEGCKRLLEAVPGAGSVPAPRSGTSWTLNVRVAAIYSVGLWDMGRYVEQFESLQPHARVHIDYVHPDQVYQRVLDGTVDLGLVSFPGRLRELTVLPWREEEMVVACSPTHPLALLQTVQPVRLDGEKFVAFDKDLDIRREIDRFLRDRRIVVDVVLEFDNIENIKKGVEVSGGVSLLPEPTLRQELQAGTLRVLHLEGPRFVRPLGIIHRRRQLPGSAAPGFYRPAAGGRNLPSADDSDLPRPLWGYTRRTVP